MECKPTVDEKTGQAAAQFGVKVGNDVANVRGGVFASTPKTNGPVTTGVYGAVNTPSQGLAIEHSKIAGGASTTTVGGHLNSTGGHRLDLEVSRVPQFNVTTMQATGTANLYTSPSGNLNLNATGNANHNLRGPRRGKTNYSTGLNLRYNF